MVGRAPSLVLFFFIFLIAMTIANTGTAPDSNLSPSASQSGKGCPVRYTLNQVLGTGRCDPKAPVADVSAVKRRKRGRRQLPGRQQFLFITPRGGRCKGGRVLNGACVRNRLLKGRLVKGR
ncbi:unnamed protein product [Allacma fusca]|uniref:Uncharacterized protein n=1 Tax=Allacma fusca TaxID=39272 RepID=A0A8J2LXT7_9HEXA|nr:unnamed protein product [Allacma fusca]